MDAYSLGKAGKAMIGGAIVFAAVCVLGAFAAGVFVGWLL